MENHDPVITIDGVTQVRSEMETELERDVFDMILQLSAEERTLNLRLLSTQFSRNGMCNTLIGLRNGEATAEAVTEDFAQEETDEVETTES